MPDAAALAAEQAQEECFAQTQSLAADHYNAEHGTNVGPADLGLGVFGCGESDCTQPTPLQRALRGEWVRLMMDMGCYPGPKYTLETDPDAVVTLQVEPGTNFIMTIIGVH
jgi:hypothetical protein